MATTAPAHDGASTQQRHRAEINSRLDRLPSWGLNPLVYVVLGLCYLLAFYDIAVIGVALPTVVDQMHLSGSQEALPITTNLVGYIIGAYFLGNLADRLGRRKTLAIVVVVLAVASVLTALSWNVGSLALFRFIAGIGIGTQVTLSATLISEFAPASKRGRYLARNIVWAAVGNMIPGLIGAPLLTLPGSAGWRTLFGLAGILIFALVLFNDRILPESPRWLAAHGDYDRADRIVTGMERRCEARSGTLPPVPELDSEEATTGFPTSALFKAPYLSRLIPVFLFWFVAYFAIYAFIAYETTLMDDLKVGLPSSVLLTGLGFSGGVLAALAQPLIIDRLERKYNVMLGLTVFGLGLALFALAQDALMVGVGSFLTSAGVFMIIIPAYAYTGEVFPTRARASAMGVGDGLGHAGGAVQPYIVVPLLAAAGARSVFWMLAALAVVAMLIMLTAVRTNRRPLTELAR